MARQENTYKHYKDISILPMWNYYKALETDDLRYLLKGVDYEELPDYKGDLSSVWNSVNLELYEYSISKNQSAKNNFNKQKHINELKYQYQIIQNIINYLCFYKDEEVINKLSKLGYKIDLEKNYEEEILRVKKRSQNLVVKINVSELEINKSSDNNNSDHYSELNSIRRHTGLPIDEKIISIKEYFNIKYDVIRELDKKELKHG